MPIIIKNRSQYTKEVVDKIVKQLEDMQQEVIDDVEKALIMLVSVEALYEIRDYIDQLILNWKDEEIELED